MKRSNIYIGMLVFKNKFNLGETMSHYSHKKIFKNIVVAMTMFNLSGTYTFFSNAHAVDAAVATPAPVDNDFLKLLDSLKNYTQTSDLALVSKVSSSFYSSDATIDKALQKTATDGIDNFAKAGDSAQTDASKAMITSLTNANVALKAKLELQKAAAKAFDDASKEAASLNKIEKSQEAQCLQGLKVALNAGSSVADDCNNLKNDDDKNNCGAELDACAKKIAADLDAFSNSYLIKRSKLQTSKAGFKEVSEEADYIAANFPASAQVCNHYSAKMASAEASGKCVDKVKNDEKNEAYQGDTVDTKALGINVSLDSNILTPEHRIPGWAKFKQLADIKIKETEAAISRVQEYLKKLGVMDTGALDGTTSTSDDEQTVGIRTSSGTTVSVGLIKRFFATNPSPDDILREAAGLGLTKAEIAHAMNIAGYGGEKPSDLNNYAQTHAQEAKYASKIDDFVTSKGGKFTGAGGGLQVPGITQVDATKNVMSNKGWVTPAAVKQFLDTNPSDQQFFSKMSELGLRTSDLGSILNGQGMLFKDGDWRQTLLNDKDYGSILNRLQNELYQGTTGYGVADTYDPLSPIVKGTGHISDEVNKTWIPYGFTNITNQHVDTTNQAPAPTTFISGGQFGTGKSAVRNSPKKLKVIKPEELKKLTKK